MNALAGTAVLTRLWLRRDRIMIPVWLYLLAAYLGATAIGFKGLYDTARSRASFVAGINGNGATRALYGMAHQTRGVAGLVGWRTVIVGSAFVAVMNILLVVRHTRAEEESGRLELVGAAVVGRRAPLTAGLAVAATADAALAVAATAVLAACGMPVAGSAAVGLAWAATGLAYAGVAAVTAQLTDGPRSANGIALGVLGVLYLVRAAGDAARVPALTWLSPNGWAGHVRPYAGERWAVLALPLACAALLTAAGYALAARRDVGAGLWAARPGPAQAPAALRGTGNLAWRLQRGTLAGWTAGLAGYGLVVGGIADGIGDLVNDSAGTRRVIGDLGGHQSLVDAFLATSLGMLALGTAAYGLQAVLRLRGEETGGRLELLAAAPVTRLRWAAGHLLTALLGTVAVALATGLAAGIAHGARSGDAGQIPRLALAALTQLPAVWTVVGCAVALVGLAPAAAASGSWGVLAAALLLGEVAPTVHAPRWVLDLSPFTHSPHAPGGPVSAAPLLWLTLAAAALTAAGLYGLRRRDLGS